MSDPKKNTKGAQTRAKIIQDAIAVYNEYGISLTIDELAAFMDCKKSSITNYFPNKMLLSFAIAGEYESEINQLSLEFGFDNNDSFKKLVTFYSKILDIQFRYRTAINIILNHTIANEEASQQIKASFNARVIQVKQYLTHYYLSKILTADILEKDKFDTFIVHFFTMSSQWISYYEMYEKKKDFKVVKPKYMKAIFQCFIPYFTKKGKIEFDSIDFNQIANKP